MGVSQSTKEWELAETGLPCGYCPKKTRKTVDHHQTSALRNCCFNCHAGQSHKDNVHCTAIEEQLEAKEVQLSQPSSTSLLMISSGLTWGSSFTSLLLISPETLCVLKGYTWITIHILQHWQVPKAENVKMGTLLFHKKQTHIYENIYPTHMSLRYNIQIFAHIY